MEDDNTTTIDDTPSSQPIQFALLLIVEIPAILCTILILIYLFRHWHKMITKALRNHAILLLIITSFFYITLDLPFTINSYRLGYDSPRTLSFCRWWYWIDYTLVVISLFLTATASVQRHILIFNAHFLQPTRVRFVFHYIPLIICLLYPPIFYLLLIYFYPCEDSMDEYIYQCPDPCYDLDLVLFNIDYIINTLVPVGVIVFANLALVCRVIYTLKKFRRKKSLIWKRQRKLTRELLIISSVYAVGWGPSTIVSIVDRFFLPNFSEEIPMLDYLNYLSYFVCPLQPFVCLIILPELVKSIKNCMKRLTVRSIVTPEVLVLRAFR